MAHAPPDASPEMTYGIIDFSQTAMQQMLRYYSIDFFPREHRRWVGHPWVLKKWYDNANRLRKATGAALSFREWAARDPASCHPATPLLFDYSNWAWEEYARCEVLIYVHPGGPAHAHLNTIVMKLYRRDNHAGVFGVTPHWMSIVDPKFKLHLGPRIFGNNRVPESLLLVADMLQQAGVVPFPATAIVQPTKILWAKVRWAVAVRPYIKHWLEDYAVRNGGPGGRFHLEGVAGFEEVFLS